VDPLPIRYPGTATRLTARILRAHAAVGEVERFSSSLDLLVDAVDCPEMRGIVVYGIMLVLTAGGQPISAQQREAIPKPAADYLVAAFEKYPLIGLSEWHGAPETMNFIRSLIRHPSFAVKVTDIVVEYGNARYQALMDGYTNGENVSREELKQLWENTTQISGVWSSPIYEEFFADVRAFNQTLPAAKRIRVLLGDPPIDWERVTGPADEDMNDWRDAHFAWVVEKQVIQKGRKALLFIGGAHLSRKVMFPNSLIHILDSKFPGKTLVASVIQVPRLKPHLGAALRSWPVPSVAEIRDTALGAADVRDVGFGFSRGRLQDDIDVVLFLGAEEFSNVAPRIEPNSRYGVELRRRQKLQEETLPFRGGKIRYHHGSAALLPGSETALEAVAAELRHDRGLVVFVKAHADKTEPNVEELSRTRALFVRDWLVQHGVADHRLAIRACGSSRPAWDSDTEQHRAVNRRAEVVRQTRWAGCQPPSSFDGI
jgi:outer membrane protein OmpA-like peptidoglycan-associated protein